MPRRVGLVLCGAPGDVTARLATLLPGRRVRAGHGLCAAPEQVRAWAAAGRLEAAVVVPCSDPCGARLAWALTDLGPFAVQVLDAGPWPDADRLMALVLGKLRRALAGSAPPPESVRYRLPLQGAPGRRELFTLAGRALPTPLPIHDPARCRARAGCRRCVEGCPGGALAVAGARLRLDRSRCEGCGCCVTTCPADALTLPGASAAEVLAEVRGVLAVPGGPGVALFHCATERPPLPPAAFAVPVPCAAMLSVRWLLAPLAEGAAGVLVWEPPGGCPGDAPARVRAAVALARSVLSGLGLEPERVAAVASPPAGQAAAERLTALARLAPGDAEGPIPELPEILRRLAMLARSPVRRLAGEMLPFGTPAVEVARCSLCGVCAGVCPTGALAYEEDGREARLTVVVGRCDACRACEPACPEGALTVRRELLVHELGTPRLLHRSPLVRCRRCRAVVAPTTLVRAVRPRLRVATVGLAEYCPRCRLAAALPRTTATR